MGGWSLFNKRKSNKTNAAMKKDLSELKCCIQKDLREGDPLYQPTIEAGVPLQVGTGLDGAGNVVPEYEVTIEFAAHAGGAALALPAGVLPTHIVGWNGYVVTAGGGGSEFALPNNNSSIAHTSGAATISAFVHTDHASADGTLTIRYQ